MGNWKRAKSSWFSHGKTRTFIFHQKSDAQVLLFKFNDNDDANDDDNIKRHTIFANGFDNGWP